MMACRLVRRQTIILKQFWNIVNCTLRNNFRWNFNRNSYICIQENVLKNVVCKMVAILSRPHYVKTLCLVTLWGLDKMATILQTFSNLIPCMKIVVFQFKLPWNLTPRVQSIISQHGTDNGLAPNMWQAIIWINDGLIYWSIFTYASLGLNELTPSGIVASRCFIYCSVHPCLFCITENYFLWKLFDQVYNMIVISSKI